MIKIGILVSPIAAEHVKNAKIFQEDDYEITYYQYNDLIEAETICTNNINKTDVFILGGEYLYRVFKNKSIFQMLPFYCIRFSNKEDLYSLLLKLSFENSKLDLSRTYIDIINNDNNYLGLKDIIPQNQFPLFPTFPFDELYSKRILDDNLNLYRAGKLDRCITAMGSIVPALKEAGIETYYLYPSNENIINTFNSVLNDIKINKLEQEQITAVGNISIYNVSMHKMNLDFQAEENQFALFQALNSFLKIHNIPFAVQKREMSFEVITSKRVLKELTNNYNHCLLLDYLQQSISFKVNIGWGEGQLETARQRAYYANKEAEKHKGGCTFVITSENHVIGPLGLDNCMAYSSINNPLLSEISNKAKLSPATVQKIIGVIKKLNTNELTASDVAYYLEITVTSANKIIGKLVSSGYAFQIYTKSEKLRGRPKAVFAINLPLDNPESAATDL